MELRKHLFPLYEEINNAINEQYLHFRRQNCNKSTQIILTPYSFPTNDIQSCSFLLFLLFMDKNRLMDFVKELFRVKSGLQVVNPVRARTFFSFSLPLQRRRRRASSGSSSRLVGTQTTEVLGCATSSANIPVSWRLTRLPPRLSPPLVSLSLSIFPPRQDFNPFSSRFFFARPFLRFRNYRRGRSKRQLR